VYNDSTPGDGGRDGRGSLDNEEDEALTDVLFNSKLISFIESCETKGYGHLIISEKEKRFHRQKRAIGESLFALHGHFLESRGNGTSPSYIAILVSPIEANAIPSSASRAPSVSFSFRPRESSVSAAYMYSEKSTAGGGSGRLRKFSVESGNR
jgi:hypothetical protein